MSQAQFLEDISGGQFCKYPALVRASEIILIDDDIISNSINKRLLNNTFADKLVRVFTDIDEAANYLRAAEPRTRFIFLDLNFPASKTGFDFLDACKDFDLRSPVIVLTASIDPEDSKNVGNYENVISFLYKPLLIDLLLNKV